MHVQELNQDTAQIQNAYKNQNVVRTAVQSLLAAEDLIGGVGSQVSSIAREINNSVEQTVRAEQKIQSRSALLTLLVGGDSDTARELKQTISQNEEKIQNILQLMGDCNCDNETKQILQEQIQNMEQEQTRLQELADSQDSNGLFGWLINLFK